MRKAVALLLHLSLITYHLSLGGRMLAIRLMRMGAKKRPSYRVVVKEKMSKRDGAYVENVGFYNPTREPAEVRLKMDRVNYWIARGAQPTDTVHQLVRQQSKAEPAAETTS